MYGEENAAVIATPDRYTVDPKEGYARLDCGITVCMWQPVILASAELHNLQLRKSTLAQKQVFDFSYKAVL